VFQKALRWRRIQSNPTTCYQAAMLLILFALAEVERLVYDLVLHDPRTFELFQELSNMDNDTPPNTPHSSTCDDVDPQYFTEEWRPNLLPNHASKVSQSCYNPHCDSSKKFKEKYLRPKVRLAQAQMQMIAEQFDQHVEQWHC
jgi:hypothetical protein